MKQFKIGFALFGILCGFMLNGCLNGGAGNGASSASVINSNNKMENTPHTIGANSITDSSSSLISETINNALHNSSKDIHPIITNFTLWANKDDVNTAFAGEIIGNSITVQVTSNLDLTTPLFITYAGSGYIELRTTERNILIPNNSLQYVSESQTFVGLKNGKAQTYNVSVIKVPYFTFYNIANVCVNDIDGNTWPKRPNTVYSDGEWKTTLDYINKSFYACGIPAQKWTLPSSAQITAMINMVPLAFRFPAKVSPDVIPTAWFNSLTESGIKLLNLPPLVDFWSSEEDKTPGKYPNNALAMRLNATNPGIVSNLKQDYFAVAWPVSNGDGSKAKTITDFTFTPENGAPAKGLIVGNQIFVTVGLWVNPGSALKARITTSTSGGTVSYNSIPVINETSLLSYNVSQAIPITVTAKNGTKNIYTLYIKATPATPPIKPNVPGLVTVCTSSNTVDPTKKFNRKIITTVGNNFYQNYLPLPGTCSQLSLGNTSLKDLAAHNVMWYSYFNENPIASTKYVDNTGYYNDIILKFLWIPSDPHKPDPSGFWLTVTMDPSCHHDSHYPNGVTPSCLN